MKLRTFTGINMKDAVRQVRAALGESAIILSDRMTTAGVEVTVMTDATEETQEVTPPSVAAAAASPLSAPAVDGPALRETLLWHRIPEVLVDDLMTTSLAGGISRLVRFGSFSFSPSKAPLALAGPPGSGKTLSVAKLATRLVFSGNAPLVISTDCRRDGGIEQLAVHTRRLGIPLLAAGDISTLKRALGQRKNGQPVLIDTAATDPYALETHAVLTELTSATRAQICLTLPAGYDTEESADIAEIFSKAGTRMMIPTRMDQSRRVGNILTAAACGLVLTEGGISDTAPDGLVRLSAELLAERLSRQGDPVQGPAVPDTCTEKSVAPRPHSVPVSHTQKTRHVSSADGPASTISFSASAAHQAGRQPALILQ